MILNELKDDWQKLGDCELKFCRVRGVPNSFSVIRSDREASF
jgi:hypothetical protein